MPTAVIDEDTDGEILIAAPGAGKQIRILGWDVTGADAVEVSFKSNTDVLWKTLAVGAAGSGIVIPMNVDRDTHCATNTALTIGLSGSVRVVGSIDYCVDTIAL